MKRALIVSVCAGLCASGAVFAQDRSDRPAPPQQQPQQPPPNAAQLSSAPADSALSAPPAQPAQPQKQVNIGTLRQTHGGSLLQASLLAPSDTDEVKLNDVSFYAIESAKPKTLKKHDLVTIIVHEESTASSTGTTDLKKNADLDAKLSDYVTLNGLRLQANQPTVAPEINLTGQRDFKGDATVNRSDTFDGRITAEVVDVKPNGTLVVQARKRIRTDEEEQDFSMTGICRAEDITADNTVLSTQLYDMEFAKNSKGAVRDTGKRGWMPRLLDFINPF